MQWPETMSASYRCRARRSWREPVLVGEAVVVGQGEQLGDGHALGERTVAGGGDVARSGDDVGDAALEAVAPGHDRARRCDRRRRRRPRRRPGRVTGRRRRRPPVGRGGRRGPRASMGADADGDGRGARRRVGVVTRRPAGCRPEGGGDPGVDGGGLGEVLEAGRRGAGPWCRPRRRRGRRTRARGPDAGTALIRRAARSNRPGSPVKTSSRCCGWSSTSSIRFRPSWRSFCRRSSLPAVKSACFDIGVGRVGDPHTGGEEPDRQLVILGPVAPKPIAEPVLPDQRRRAVTRRRT